MNNGRMKKKITIEIEGETEYDLELALDEAVSRIEDGNVFGFDSNESGRFTFTVTSAD